MPIEPLKATAPAISKDTQKAMPTKPTRPWLKIGLAIAAVILVAGYFARNLLFAFL